MSKNFVVVVRLSCLFGINAIITESQFNGDDRSTFFAIRMNFVGHVEMGYRSVILNFGCHVNYLHVHNIPNSLEVVKYFLKLFCTSTH